MKKITSEPLIELINSLSPSEKRYFRKNTSVEGNYSKLFNSIDALKENYSEENLKNSLKNENFVKHLFVTKNQLYEVVLNSLFDFYEDSTIDNKIKRKLNHIEMLAKKGLHQQAVKLSKKIFDELEKYELFNLMPVLLDWQKYFTTYYGLDERDNINNEIYKKEETCFKMIKCNADYYRLFSELYSFTTRNRTIRSENNENYLKEFMSNNLLNDYSHAITFKSKIYFFRIHLLYQRLQKNYEDAFELTKSILGLYELNPHMIQKNKKNFLDENLSYLIYCMNTKKTEEFYKHLPVFRGIPEKYKFKMGEAEINIIFESYIVEMAFNHYLGNHNKVIDAIPFIEDYIDKNKLKLRYPLQSNLYSNVASSFFHLENYRQCIIWGSKYLNDRTLDAQFDLRVRILLMAIISNYELKYFEKMESLILSAERYLNKFNEPMKYEKELLSYLKQLTHNKTEDQSKNDLINLNSKIMELKKDELIADSLQYFEPAAWVDKKLKLISFNKNKRGG